MTDAPPGWRATTLGEVADTALGKMLDRGNHRGLPEVPYLRNVNVQWGRIDTDDLLTMELSDGERERFGVRAGDLLVCEGGEVGRCAIWHGRDAYIAFQKALHRVRPHADVDSRFVRYLLEYQSLTGLLGARATGSTIKHLPQDRLRTLPLHLPTLSEQHRILDALEDHLSRLDVADDLLKQLRDRGKALLDSLLEQTLYASCGVVPVATVGTVADLDSGPAFSSELFGGPGEGTRLLRGDNIEPGRLRWERTRTWPASQMGGFEHLLLRAGDLILAMDRPVVSAGLKLATVKESDLPALLVQRVARIRPRSDVVDADYLLHVLASRRFVRTLVGNQVGTQIPHITLKAIRNFVFPLPDLATQRVLSARLNSARQSCERLEMHLAAQLLRSKSLRRRLLVAAFSGELIGRLAGLGQHEESVGV